jgi:hypothetical protein
MGDLQRSGSSGSSSKDLAPTGAAAPVLQSDIAPSLVLIGWISVDWGRRRPVT